MNKFRGLFRIDFGQDKNFIIAFLIASPIFILFLSLPGLIQVDWRDTFYEVARHPFSPYIVKSYNYVPWPALIISPLSIFPYMVSRVINSYLNILLTFLVILKYKGGKLSLVITFLSIPFLTLFATSSIEWIVLLGLLLHNNISPILLLAKPQSAIFIIAGWYKKIGNKLIFFLPALIVFIFSFILWENWPQKMLENIRFVQPDMDNANYSPFPWGIPVGLVMLYYAWKRSDELLGILSTWFLVPYLALHSMTAGIAILAAKKPRIALIVSIILYSIKIYSEFAGK